MDPNETLARIREFMHDGDSADVLLVDAFDALDEWLSRGGFLPDAWLSSAREYHKRALARAIRSEETSK